MLMLLRAIPGAEGDKEADYCEIHILPRWDFNAAPCTLLSGGDHLRRAGHPAVWAEAGGDPGLRRGACLRLGSVSPFLVGKARRKGELAGGLVWPRGCSSPSCGVLAGGSHGRGGSPVGDLLQGLLLHHSCLQGKAQLVSFKAGSKVSHLHSDLSAG